MKVCLNCGKKFPIHLKYNGKKHNCCNRKYCLECSPPGRHNTSQLHIKFKIETTTSNSKICFRCKKEYPLEMFYDISRGNKNVKYSYCRYCSIKSTLQKQDHFKLLCIDYKGGKCEICGYNKCQASLEFHHRDPSIKEFIISKYRTLKLTDECKKELEKCMLLCSNCHREVHYKNPQDLSSNSR